VIEKIDRFYLEISSIEELKEKKKPSENLKIELINPENFELNKFFYKQIGKNYQWVDRLVWSNFTWHKYTSNKNLRTYILKENEDLAGYFELILHQDKNEVEIAYLGLLEEYQNKKLGSYLLCYAIKKSFFEKPRRVWVHTCSLDHKNALNNYLSRGMKIFKKETILI